MIQGVSFLQNGALPGAVLYNQLASLLKYARTDAPGMELMRDPTTGGLLLHVDPTICPDQERIETLITESAGPIIGRITAESDGIHVSGAPLGTPASIVVPYSQAFPQSQIVYPVELLAYGVTPGAPYDPQRSAAPPFFKFAIFSTYSGDNVPATIYTLGTIKTTATTPADTTPADVEITQTSVFVGGVPKGAIPTKTTWHKDPGSTALNNRWWLPWSCHPSYSGSAYTAELCGGPVVVHRVSNNRCIVNTNLVNTTKQFDIPSSYADNYDIYIWTWLQNNTSVRVGWGKASDIPAGYASRQIGTICHAEYGGESFGVWLPIVSGDVFIELNDAT